MGEAGQPVDYILYYAAYWQIRAIMRGNSRRSRSIFEAARIISFVSASSLGGTKNKSLDDFLPFPWDKTESKKDVSDDEYEKLQRLIESENNRLNPNIQ